MNIGYIINISPDIIRYYIVNTVSGTSNRDTILLIYIGVCRYLKPWLRPRLGLPIDELL